MIEMEEKKIRFKDLSGWLKFGIVGGIIYLTLITLGLTIAFFALLFNIFL